MDEEKLLENIGNSIASKLKVPIITTYISVLIIFNWDILFYLIFSSEEAKIKIQYIKDEYGAVHFERIAICLLVSMLLIIIFTVINTLLNYCLKWFYRKDKEITSEIESFEKISLLSQQLSTALDNIKGLSTQLETLQNINNTLSTKSLDINIKDISKKDYQKLISALKSKPNSDKLLFSLKELLNNVKLDSNQDIETIYKTSTYEVEMKSLIAHLSDENLLRLKLERTYKNGQIQDSHKLVLTPSFKDFLKMEI
ncbi:MAG TPA: hypothetical protein VIH02_02875 [Flavobacterium sp.]